MRRTLCCLLALLTLSALTPPVLRGTLGGSGKSRAEKLDFLRRFKEGNRMTYAVAVAENRENLPEYGVNAFPTSFVIDRRGTVRLISTGASQRELERLADMIDKLMARPDTIFLTGAGIAAWFAAQR